MHLTQAQLRVMAAREARCQSRWVAGVVIYAECLETTVIALRNQLSSGDWRAIAGTIKDAAEVAGKRDLVGELKTERMKRDMQKAAAAREAGRLH